MADLELSLSWLGMSNYLERFIDAGFDSWGTILEITEDDLEYLNVGPGHRRNLQREIANTKRLAQDPGFVQPLYGITPHVSQPWASMSSSNENQQMRGVATKRGYRHHPKADLNAPERPYSAYVRFSNYTRGQLKDRNLSFTELSRAVGEKWQSMSTQEKEDWKQMAAVPWQKFKAELAVYQKTDEFQDYQRYLANFKASQAGKNPVSPASAKRSPYSTGLRGLPSSPNISRQNAPIPAPQEEPGQNPSKVALKRFKKDNEGWGSTRRPTKGKQVCESCKIRKIKCSGERPECRHCRELGIDCQYKNGKRDKQQRQEDILLHKLKVYEALLLQFIPQVGDDDQQAIGDALLLVLIHSPRDVRKKTTTGTASLSHDFHGGESETSSLGSMGSTDRVNQENFGQEDNEDPSLAFAGPTSETKWIQRLKRELGRDKRACKSKAAPRDLIGSRGIGQRPGGPNRQQYSEDMDTAIVGHQIDPFQLPLKETADALVDAYFSTVQISFPILNKADFMYQYEELFNAMDPVSYENRTFIAILQMVFAISAVHAHLTEADWAGDGRDHMLYFAQARLLAVGTGILNDDCFLGQTQVFGLGGMYLLVTDQVNRSWNITGLAVRSAQSLGLHLKNATPGVASARKKYYAKIWFAVASLESMLTIMTGRPTMINPRDCSVTVPYDFSSEDSASTTSSSEQSEQASHMDIETREISSSTSGLNEGSTNSSLGGFTEISLTPVAARFFVHYTNICALAKEVVGELYRPGIREKKWSEIQTIMSNFDRRLINWRDRLEPPFDNAEASSDPETETCRIALRIAFHSTRTIINRPCLCRIDHRIANQSRPSKETNRDFANKCVDSARAVLRLVLYKPDSIILRRGATWWMLLHHLKRALTVSLLELAFRAEHKPANADDILGEARDAIEWLRWHSASSPTARRTWVTMSRLLHLAAKKVGGDTADIITAQEEQSIDDPTIPQQQQPQPASGMEVVDPFEMYGSGKGQYFGDLTARSDLDQFGFLREEGGVGSFFPSASEVERMGQGGEGDDMQMDGYD